MKQYWHRFPGRPDNIEIGTAVCEICGEYATTYNIHRPIREGCCGFKKHAAQPEVEEDGLIRCLRCDVEMKVAEYRCPECGGSKTPAP